MKHISIILVLLNVMSCSHFKKRDFRREISASSKEETRDLSRSIRRSIKNGALSNLAPPKIVRLNKRLKDAVRILEGRSQQIIVCAPEDSTDYAIFVMPERRQIGEDISGDKWCKASLDITNANNGDVVCAPEDSADFAYFRVADGKL